MEKPLKILIVEDISPDTELEMAEIDKNFASSIYKIVNNEETYQEALQTFQPDLVISDYSLPGIDGDKVWDYAKKYAPKPPVVIFTASSIDEKNAIECITTGATVYIIKEYIKRLGTPAHFTPENKEATLLNIRLDLLLKNKQYLFERINSTIPDAIYLLDVTTDEIIYTNKRMPILLGYASANDSDYVEELPVKKMHPDDLSKITDLIKTLDEVTPGTIIEVVFRLRNKQGDWQWMLSRNIMIEGNYQGAFRLVLVSITDIHKSKTAEAELRQAHAFYKQIIDNTSDGVALYDLDLKCSLYNPTMERLTNLKHYDIIGKHPWETSRDFNKLDIKDILSRALKGEHIYSGDLSFRIPATKISLWTSNEYFPLIDSNKQIIGVVETVHEISRRKQMEQELVESEKKYRTIFNNIQDIYYETSWEGTMLEISPSVSSLSYTREDLIGSDIKELYADPNARAELLETLVQAKSLSDYEIELKDGNGNIVTISITARLITDEDGGKRITGVMRDITERVKSRQELIHAMEKAEEMNRLKSFFLANMSHELRTPLSGILGFSELLLEDVIDAKSLEKVELIHHSGKRLLKTLNSILDLSKIEANKLEIQKQKIDLNYYLSQKIKLFDVMAKVKMNELVYENSDSEIPLFTDPNILEHILNILLENAIKFTQDGEITIKVEKLEQDIKKLISIKVIDTGIGIDPMHQKLIFDPFRQVSEGYSRAYEGTGLGLTIAKKYIELLGGEISLESEINVGTTFQLKFEDTVSEEKFAEQTDEGIPDHEQEKSNNLDLIKVLVVDDDEITRIVVQNMLEGLYNLDIAENGNQALKKLEENTYQIIILDINLCGTINGLDILNSIKENERYASTPTIALTAYAMSGDAEKFLAEGFTYYVSKPFTKDDLVSLLKKIEATL